MSFCDVSKCLEAKRTRYRAHVRFRLIDVNSWWALPQTLPLCVCWLWAADIKVSSRHRFRQHNRRPLDPVIRGDRSLVAPRNVLFDKVMRRATRISSRRARNELKIIISLQWFWVSFWIIKYLYYKMLVLWIFQWIIMYYTYCINGWIIKDLFDVIKLNLCLFHKYRQLSQKRVSFYIIFFIEDENSVCL